MSKISHRKHSFPSPDPEAKRRAGHLCIDRQLPRRIMPAARYCLMNDSMNSSVDFLPMSVDEMRRLGWDCLDLLLVTGDASVDHPTSGTALLGRWLVAHGFRVGVVAQPDWRRVDDFAAMGRPRLFAGVTAGSLDSMLAHYTAFRKKRSDDARTPGGRAGARPNMATIVYTNVVRHLFPGLPVIIGGIEASMRRATHYDFWKDAIRRSILLDSKADLLVYGMAERALLEAANRLREREGLREYGDIRNLLRGIEGTAWAIGDGDDIPAGVAPLRLPSHEEILADRKKLMDATLLLERQALTGGRAIQRSGNRVTVFEPPAKPLGTEEMDFLYSLPFARRAHPSYDRPIPEVAVTQFSVTSHRGCGGGCSFCSLALHQGRLIQSRSGDSILAEIASFVSHPDWRGSVTDVGGPSANMWRAACGGDPRKCRRPSCLVPTLCPHFRTDQSGLADLLRAASRLPGVRHVRVASGIRHDLALADEKYLRAVVREFTGGQLKLAPEHRSDRVLALMRKPPFALFERFLSLFGRFSKEAGKEQYIVPYLISAFPGCTLDDMRALARWLKDRRWSPRQVQCFIPTPGTIATAMYCAGIDAEGNGIPVARTDAERLRQHRILVAAFGRKPERK